MARHFASDPKPNFVLGAEKHRVGGSNWFKAPATLSRLIFSEWLLASVDKAAV